MKLTGYLELDGSITKISSVDELKNFVERLGKEFKELSASEYVELCKDVTGESPFWDDCNILYSNDGRRLVNASCISGDYKITPYGEEFPNLKYPLPLTFGCNLST